MKFNTKIKELIIVAVLVALPAVGLALSIPAEPSRQGAINFAGFVSTAIDLVWIIFVATVVILVIITAFLFLTTGGDPEKIKKARMALLFAVIGIVVALLGYRMYATINYLIPSGSSPPTTGATGACCTSQSEGGPPTVCNVSSAASCTPENGGNYMGDGTTCAPNPC